MREPRGPTNGCTTTGKPTKQTSTAPPANCQYRADIFLVHPNLYCCCNTFLQNRQECSAWMFHNFGFYHTYLLYIQFYPVNVSDFCAIKAWYKYTPNRYENWIVSICLLFLWSSLSLTIMLNNFFYLVTVCKE